MPLQIPPSGQGNNQDLPSQADINNNTYQKPVEPQATPMSNNNNNGYYPSFENNNNQGGYTNGAPLEKKDSGAAAPPTLSQIISNK